MAMKGARSLLGKALVLIEHNNAKVSPASLSAITAASKFGDITALVAGKGCAPVAEQASKIAGVKAVVQVDSAEYDHLLPENVSKLVEKLHGAEKFSHIVAAHTAFGKSVIPRVAAVSDCQPIPDVINVVDENTFVRPTYAGNALATVKSEIDPVKMLTIRPTSFDKAGDGGSAAVTNGEACGETGGTKWVSDEVDDSGKPDLSSARVVVGGGRGLKSGENFKLLFDLADKIPNCAVGATRAVVDAGFVPNELQVGQTGKVVAPDLYIAMGLSGAIQHLAGMKDSKVIACVNTDPDAPIFSVSDYGLEGDLFDALPKLKSLV
jgi:electron transfer flavoprotein alpha subunit|uniref:Electron transfer flavoprotein subunit alpha n=1 Tax=Eutreptiella gymnastica TaxID=73025 RepID=A0A7S4CUU4_9EUGL|mmetsp:Transcript_16890/g.29394  ORF Transcript_16890/g.29394 Transcript_16890/m.29394 type:complete len:322 (+) Transcript_16890:36-1001(+)|eukprot:CAMPEP_0174284554 /NCGR_PEP_ID=MMETSP0809-20121228/5941_1 /TAXON_ID=73025 ORGANISM="Eutreptiella gymnastica-like, Strain CCMP1594" /NCGR_SAMPLE_ID=MMETSP0809 /ASSEMBLY_ACC=CAM_ASM_000658 /LENGTH=321 /DNA_ID=CAMNT_0015380093 /DNA_START=37 /DNA_END=1002 /DNA_ORIENTATION=-